LSDFAVASRAYLEFRKRAGAEGEEFDSVSEGHGLLYHDLHESDPQAAYDLARAATELPEAGTEFLGFRLIQVLGRGAFGKVYLAEQGDLANRPVALKVATDIFAESQTLAQLQHTNIVPLYSTHRAGPFQAVCMPYFGPTTLADVLAQVSANPSLPDSGKILVSTVNMRKASTQRADSDRPKGAKEEAKDPVPSSVPLLPRLPEADARTLHQLEDMTYVQAVLSMGARLADGLAHAHERGILHRDLKPANILLTDAGEPMLLDFNLSQDTKLRSGAAASIGGTLPYMAPEHLQAFAGGTEPVDARSDLFALGVILYELLAGKHPYPDRDRLSPNLLEEMTADRRQPPPRLGQTNPAVSPAAEAIVRRCLQPDPALRYQTARALQEDLERQLNNLPLKHTAEPSLRERGRKWIRRHPRLTSTTAVGLVLSTILVVMIGSYLAHERRLARLQAVDDLHQFDDAMKSAQVVLYSRYADRQQLDEGLGLARTALGRYGVLENPEWREAPAVYQLPPEDQERLGDAVGELLFLVARNTTQYACYHCPPAEQPQQYRAALGYNTQAESCYPPDRIPRALWEQHADLARRLGEDKQAKEFEARAAQTPLRPEKDYYLLAHQQAIAGNYRQALELLQKATQEDPQNFSAWFVRGNCYYELLRDGDAVACYNTCVALRPGYSWAWFNRGLAHLRLHNPRQAADDFDQAIRLQPGNLDAYLNRALALEEMGQYAAALADLDRASAIGPASSRIHFRRARVHGGAGDKLQADLELAQCVRSQPADEYDWIARGLARKHQNPEGALADFDKALVLNPRSFEGLQNKAAILSEQFKRDAESLRVLDEAVRLYPDSALSRGGRGILLARQGKRDQALADAREALVIDPSPMTLYQVAGIYAHSAPKHPVDRIQALHLLSRALATGTGLDWVQGDTDLDPIRADADFQRVVAAARALVERGPAGLPPVKN
jgi:serine/threonine protein kinase/Tfp pilus assembly protein PilF